MHKCERLETGYYIVFCPQIGRFCVREKKADLMVNASDLFQITSLNSLLELPLASCESIVGNEEFPVLMSNACYYFNSKRSMSSRGVLEPLACFPNSMLGVCSIPPDYLIQTPANLTRREVSLVGIGALALGMLRQSEATFGETIIVAGLGLLGNLVCQLGKLAGLNMVGIDGKGVRLMAAKKSGIETVDISSISWLSDLKILLDNNAIDIFINCFTIFNEDIVFSISNLLRKNATVMFMNPSTSTLLFGSEVEKLCLREKYIKLCTNIDNAYFPYSYVRWTVRRNMQQFLEMLRDGRILTNPILSGTVQIDNLDDLADFDVSPTSDVTVLEFNHRFF